MESAASGVALTLASGLGLAAGFTVEGGDLGVDLVILVGMAAALGSLRVARGRP